MTTPLPSHINLADLIGPEKLLQMQQRFFDVTGFANGCLSRDGKLISHAGNTEPTCMELIRKSPVGLQRCQALVEMHGTGRPDQPSIIQCHAGMLDGRIPVRVDGEAIGFLVMGQCFDAPPDKEETFAYAKELGIDPEHYWQAIQKVKIIPKVKIEAAAQLLEFMGNEIATMATANIRLKQEMEARKRTETELNRLNRELSETITLLRQERSLFVAGNVVIVKWRNEEGWPVEYISPNVNHLLGYTEEDFLSGKVQYMNLIPPNHLERFTNEVNGRSESEAQAFSHEPYCLTARDGKTIWVDNFTTILRDGQGRITHYLGYIVNISDLKESEERFRLLFENARDAIFLADSSGQFLMVNEQACNSLGYTQDELLAMSTEQVEIGHTEQEILEIFYDLKQGRPHRRWGTHRKKDGTTFPVEVTLSSYRTREDEIMLAVARDMSTQKKAEEEKEDLISELRQALKEIKQLSGMLPICSACKKIRDDNGYWNQLEEYIQSHSGARFSHGICPDCIKELYGEENWYTPAKSAEE